jgi:hypothetical protein
MKMRTAIVLVASGVVLSFAFTAIVTPRAVKAAIATLVRDQDNAARHAFNLSCATSTGNECSFVVPANVEYVIQSVSLYAPQATTSAVFLQTVVNGTFLNFPFPSTFTRANVSIGVINGTFYADPGTTFNVVASDGMIGPFVEANVSGYYVTLP